MRLDAIWSQVRAAGQWDAVAATLGRAGSYLLKCHLTASDTPAANRFVAQVCVCVCVKYGMQRFWD